MVVLCGGREYCVCGGLCGNVFGFGVVVGGDFV